MTVKELKNRLQQLEGKHGNINDCKIHFRSDYYSEPIGVNYLDEDLRNQLTNSDLENVVFLYDND